MAFAYPTPTAARLPAWYRRLAFSLAPSALTMLLATVALVLGWRGVDQAAATYRVVQYQLHGLMLWDSGWYAGNFPLGYSVLFPPVAALVGPQVMAVVSAVIATWAFDRFVRSYFGARPLGTWYFAVSTLLPVTIGQWPFLAGEAAGMLALVCLQRERRTLAVGLGILSTLFSPLAAAFLAMGCLAWAAYNATRRHWVFATAAICLALIIVLGVLFPGTGPFPFPWTGLVASEMLCLTALTPLVQTTPAVRLGALFYAAASLFSFVVPNPLGGNAPRLAASVGVPLLACFLTAPGPAVQRLSQSRAGQWLSRGRTALLPHKWRYAALLVVVPFAVWQWAPSDGIVTSPGRTPFTQASFYKPLISELGHLTSTPVRVEVTPTFEHWESAFVAPYVPLARGWERQLDTEDNSLFYTPGALTASSYEAWLRAEGISYVALPAAPLDYAAKAEGALLRSGTVTDLVPVWSTSHWRLWRVSDSPGLVTGPARLVTLEPDHLTLQVSQAGPIVVRVRYTKLWGVSVGAACVGPSSAPTSSSTSSGAPAGPSTSAYQWTAVNALIPGTIELSASMLHPAPVPGGAGGAVQGP